ncbi:bolA-like protein 3 [Hydractinia symbiolongicarpus]|uniref:bolA-like protein 3 n=1 Tax=Hydractinia symbiolongicarpus TaxID=13093 RepID=UPI00254A627C|nr:bolA-like protein 3 [Hydractinia symbiolongicarpus]
MALFKYVRTLNYVTPKGSLRPCNVKKWFSTGTEGEKHIESILRENLKVHEVDVRDISGGCGSMYEVFVSSVDFKGKRILQQHKLVNEILKDEVKQMHGLRIQTEVPKEGT